ncbi:Inhibitor of growth protein 4 [Sarcoptes scabiei]|uniref:Inhibitor of growth protein n=1 Tax=Sarcoptes scabiei TaxID=52283 RepID=A0A834VDV7_SARSC|nr:Inhibitor of growth protein 4 [Sarcoptes scabiei]
MAETYLEQFIESIQTLPCDLIRNLSLIHDLDIKVRELDPESKTNYFDQIMNHMDRAQLLSEDKKELAHQIYNLVDKHIRRLDTELSRFDIDLDVPLDETTKDNVANKSTINKKKRLKTSTKSKSTVISKTCNNKSVNDSNDISVNDGNNHSSSGSTSMVTKKINNSSELLEMEVDPNEPIYCICRRVSFGEMVGCDDPDCQIEWFHFACVGFTSKPKGKWYCPQCTLKRKSRQT